MNFERMTAAQLTAELERYQLQLLRQQDNGEPLTDAQKKRFYTLRAAYNRKQAQENI